MYNSDFKKDEALRIENEERMNFFLVLGIALALAMDAFGVTLGISASLKSMSRNQVLRVAFAFGFFQFMMPVLGWSAGSSIEKYIRDFDHWVGFGLLLLIGGRMVYASFKPGREAKVSHGDPTKGRSLFLLAVATSIDALAVGLSLAVFQVGILYVACIIGLVAFLMTVLGAKIGSFLGKMAGKRAELVGGIILIIIGIKILTEHL